MPELACWAWVDMQVSEWACGSVRWRTEVMAYARVGLLGVGGCASERVSVW
jgi:hypothetical protein